MLDIHSIASQVKHNCNISDARYWGFYTTCELLLRLRDLFRIEKGLKPWARVNHNEIRDWISKREELWKELENLDFQEIEIKGKRYKPFNIKGINSVLLEHRLLYGAGYGKFLKPSFLLAELSRKTRMSRYTIYLSDREIACDLSGTPAMLQGNTIIVRGQTTGLFLWGKFEEVRLQRHAEALRNAFSEYGISTDINSLSEERFEKHFTKITDEELSTYIHHEIGEASQRRLLGKWWKELLSSLPHSRAELFIRGLKDVLSDTCKRGMLSHIIRHKKAGSLSFYVSSLSGFRKLIFPDIVPVYKEFIKTRNWALIEKIRADGYKRAHRYISILREMADKGNISAKKIESKLVSKIL